MLLNNYHFIITMHTNFHPVIQLLLRPCFYRNKRNIKTEIVLPDMTPISFWIEVRSSTWNSSNPKCNTISVEKNKLFRASRNDLLTVRWLCATEWFFLLLRFASLIIPTEIYYYVTMQSCNKYRYKEDFFVACSI